MRLELDENLEVGLVALLRDRGVDADAVRGEGLSGSPDEGLYQACQRSDRTLVTLDLDFSNPIRFPPGPTPGIIVLRPSRPVLSQIRATLDFALPALERLSLRGKLWIVDPARIRMYDPADRNPPR